MNLDEAAKAAKNGAIAAFISAGITFLIVLYATLFDERGAFKMFNDPLNFIDVGLILICGFGMLKKSRAAAITISIYFVLAKIGIAMETGKMTGTGGALIFLYFFGKAVQGTFNYHKIMKSEDSDYKAASKWTYYLGIPVIALLLIMMGFGILTMTDAVPSTEVLVGSEVSTDNRTLLVENEILFEDERIEYFYSYGFASILEGGDILSDRAVITYFIDENEELVVYELQFADIVTVELMERGDFLNDSIYKVSGEGDENWFTIELSTESDGDKTFVKALRRKISAAHRL